jgi:hypothetical protein
MHVLIGFAVLVGLIAFAFGGNTAVNFVHTVLFVAIVLILAGLAYVAVDVLRPDVPIAASHENEHLRILHVVDCSGTGLNEGLEKALGRGYCVYTDTGEHICANGPGWIWDVRDDGRCYAEDKRYGRVPE